MVLTVNGVREQLKTLIKFLEPVHSLANSHFGSFFTEKLWETQIPANIKSELNDENSINNFIKLYPQLIKNNFSNDFIENHSNLVNFLQTAVNISVNRKDNYLKFLSDLENLSKGRINIGDIEMKEFMSPKKFHEVEVTSKIAALLCHLTESSHLVDVGGGKGYLSCILALHYNFKVLGLDSSEVTTCGAIKRSEKVAKLWSGDVLKETSRQGLSEQNGEIGNKSTKKTREEFIKNHYKQCITFVSPHTDVEKLLSENFQEKITNITLTGLHTCGDLASTSLEMFLKNNKIKAILNVGCCYHHISEQFSSDGLMVKKSNHFGFPLSDYLKNEKFYLGRNARMLAAHSLDRIDSNLSSDFSQTSIFYRAILQTVISENIQETYIQGQVGRLAKKCRNFHEYMFTALKKLNCNINLTDNDLDKLYERYIGEKKQLTAFYLLRITLAPVVESIILLDRILYLMENGVRNLYLVPLFDLAISPRGVGIIAWKDKTTENV